MATMTAFIPVRTEVAELINNGDVEARRELNSLIIDALDDLTKSRNDAVILESIRRIDPDGLKRLPVGYTGFYFQADGVNPTADMSAFENDLHNQSEGE